LAPRTILLVDGNSDTVDMYALALSSAGYWVLTATDVNTAERAVKTHRPHVVVTDVALPGIAGWDLIRGLKADPLSRDIPVVVVTGRLASVLEADARELGCAMVLQKPCLPDELTSVIRRLLPPIDPAVEVRRIQRV
jgi:DNA-binding response OmpR family regulator